MSDLEKARELKEKYWDYPNRQYFSIEEVVEFLEKMKEKVDNEEDVTMINYLLHQMTYHNYQWKDHNSRNQWW